MTNTLVPNGAIKGPTRDEAEGRGRVYVHQPYPAVRYHPDGRVQHVADAAADRLLPAPWQSAPFAQKRPTAPPPPDPTPDQLKQAINELRAELGRQRDNNEALAKELEGSKAFAAERVIELMDLRAKCVPVAHEDPQPEPEADGSHRKPLKNNRKQ